MKKLNLLLLLFVFCVGTTFAQIKEGNMSMSLGNNNGFTIDLPGADIKEVEKEWYVFAKKLKAKTKKDKKSGEIFSDDAEVKNMSRNTVDVYTKFAGNTDGSTMNIWFDLGGAFLTSSEHPEAYQEAEKMIYKFAISVSRTMIEDQLKEEEKVLKKLEGDQKKLEKDKEGYEKEIEVCEEKIVQAKNDIEQNGNDQVAKKSEIEAQMKVVEEIQRRLKDLD